MSHHALSPIPVPIPIPVEGSGSVSEKHFVAADDGTLTLSPEGTVLVVDPDGVTRRYVELALEAVRGVRVVTAASAAEALEIASCIAVDLVMAASRLRDADGLELRRRMSRDPRVARVPFIVLSSDQRPGAKVAAFVAGVDDYLVKPCDGAELAARVVSQIARTRRWRACTTRPRAASLAGDFETLPLADLVAALELGGHSGKMSITTGRAAGELTVEAGRVVNARFAGLVGVAAFARLLDEKRGTFELIPLTGAVGDSGERTITMSATALLMESARINDERRAGGIVVDEGSAEPVTGVLEQLPARDLARVFEYGMTDGWSPGEITVIDGPELQRWTRDALARERFHVLLVGEVPSGVAAMFSLATPPGPGPLCEALRGEPCAAILTTWLRGDRVLDVVLLDATNPAALKDELCRRPALVIVAPPGGDPQALAPRARAGLAQLVATLAPPVLLGVGRPELDDYLDAYATEDGPTVVRGVRGTLGDDVDLRRVIVEGLRLYGMTGGRARWASR